MTPQRSAAHLDAYWIPFTAKRSFKKKPGLIAEASGGYCRGAQDL